MAEAAPTHPRREPAPGGPRAVEHAAGPRSGDGATSREWRFASRRDDDPRRVDEYDAPVYVISVAADLADMHPQTLRTYEREGLIRPTRTEGNTRRYSRRDVDRLKFIRHLTQEEGLNLAGVRVVLEMGEKLEGARRRVGELEEVVRALASRLEDDVDAAHRSHRFEIIPAGSRAMEPHERRRRTATRP